MRSKETRYINFFFNFVPLLPIIEYVSQLQIITTRIYLINMKIYRLKLRNFTRFIALLICMTNFAYGYAQIQTPVKWNRTVNYISDNEAELVFDATIQKDWHLYSQYQNGMALPLRFNFVADESNYKSLGDSKLLEKPKYEEHYDEVFKETERYLKNKARFTYKVKLLTNKSFDISGSLDGQACIEGKCVQVQDDFTFNIKERVQKSVDAKAISPKTVVKEDTENLESAKPDTMTMLATNSADSVKTLKIKEVNETSSEESSLIWFFLIAFLGGLVGILTPCVFPMIPMTVSYFMKHGGKKQAIFYGTSIVAIYVIFGVLMSAIFGQGFANFISTHWIPNVIFSIIFVLFAFSLFGYFEISLPSKWINKSAKNEEKAGYAGTFFMALTLVLVSFSCTLPIAGTVALNAAGGDFFKPIIGMLGFSLAFALPFTFFAFFPNLLNKMPKSGGWMNTLKVVLAFVELAFALKFLSVPDQAYHWGILDREIYLAIWIVIFSMLGFYLLGKLRFPLDSEMPTQKSWLRFSTAIITLTFVVYMIPGLFGAPLNALSGWLPPMSTQDFNINKTIYVEESDNNLSATPTFGDKLKSVRGLNAYFDYDEAVKFAKKQNKPLFLDFTGHGCVNCRQVEQEVLSNYKIQKLINNEFVMCTLYVDDKIIELPENLQIIDNNGNTINMLGKKNSYLQNTKFKQNSQPCYIVINPYDESVMSGPIFFETDVDKYEVFLKEGMNSFAKK